MRIEGDIYINPNTKWSKVNTDDIDGLISQYYERIKSYYIAPIHQLFSDKDRLQNYGFAAGVLLFSTIDAVGTFQTKRKGFENKFLEFIKDEKEFMILDTADKVRISKIISDDFRNGLIHNGRIKNAYAFSFESGNLFYLTKNTLIINPLNLLGCVERNVDIYFKMLKDNADAKAKFKDDFITFYEQELSDYK